jgi:hypothetical protein
LRCSIQHILTLEMHRRRSSYWAWSEDTWHAIVGTSRVHFEAVADGPKCRSALVAVAMLLQRPIAVTRLGRFDRVALAYRIFGRHEVDPGLARVGRALAAWGYTLQTPAQSSLRLALCEVFLTIKSPRLEDVTAEALSTLRQAIASSHATLRGSLRQLSRALVGLGILGYPVVALMGSTVSRHQVDSVGPLRSRRADARWRRGGVARCCRRGPHAR